MRTIVLFSLTLLAAFAADAAWKKLGDWRTGMELKIYERGSSHPRQARFNDTTADSLLVIVKNEQVSIPRDRIDRIDYRPLKKVGPKTNTQTKVDDAAAPPSSGPQGPSVPIHTGSGLPGSSSTTTISTDSGEFQTIYRRPPAPLK